MESLDLANRCLHGPAGSVLMLCAQHTSSRGQCLFVRQHCLRCRAGVHYNSEFFTTLSGAFGLRRKSLRWRPRERQAGHATSKREDHAGICGSHFAIEEPLFRTGARSGRSGRRGDFDRAGRLLDTSRERRYPEDRLKLHEVSRHIHRATENGAEAPQPGGDMRAVCQVLLAERGELRGKLRRALCGYERKLH